MTIALPRYHPRPTQYHRSATTELAETTDHSKFYHSDNDHVNDTVTTVPLQSHHSGITVLPQSHHSGITVTTRVLPQWRHNHHSITTVAPQNHRTITLPPQKHSSTAEITQRHPSYLSITTAPPQYPHSYKDYSTTTVAR